MTGERWLEGLGLSATEEAAYRFLLEHPGSRTVDVMSALGVARRPAKAALDELEVKGLLTRSPESTARYLPAAPDVAVKALVLRKQEELRQAELATTRLQELARRGRTVTPRYVEEAVELITGADAVVRWWDRLQAAAEHEVLGVNRPPYARAEPENPVQFEALARGVSYRQIYDRDGLGAGENLGLLLRCTAAGEQARVFSPVPTKIFVIDRRVAIIPLLDDGSPRVSGALLLRAPAVVDALVMFFETLWARATPLVFASGDTVENAGNGSARDELLTPLLAAGLSDHAIARQLGVSTRTVERRIRTLMGELDAHTRFQAGWVAALQHQAAPGVS